MWGFSRWVVTKAAVYLTHWGGAAIKPAEGLSLAHDQVNGSPCRGLPHQRAGLFILPLAVSLTMACGAGKG